MPPAAAPDATADRARLLDLIHGYRGTCIIATAIELGVVDALAAAPARAGPLARELGLDAGALARLLRGMATLGLVEQRADESRLTAPGRLLADADAGLRERALLAGREYVPAWGSLAHSVTTGEPAFDRVFGASAWEHRRRHPELGAFVNRTMADDQRESAGAVPSKYDFSGCRLIVDVGGGEGRLVADILAAYAGPRAIVFDQPHVVTGAPAVLDAAGVAGRCRIAAGSFFDAVPRGGDTYLLQHILHDWSDAQAAAILRRCREAMEPGATLLVIENVVADDGSASAHVAMLDLHMLAMLGGRERTREEYRALLAGAGFELRRCLPARAAVEILVAAAR